MRSRERLNPLNSLVDIDTLENQAVFCESCHDAVHKDLNMAKALGMLRKGTRNKHSGATVLNQLTPSIPEHLNDRFNGNVTITEGWETKEFHDKQSIAKMNASDAYCIACTALQ